MSDTNVPNVKINPARVLIFLLAFTVLILALAMWGQYIRYYVGSAIIHTYWDEFWVDILMRTFDMNAESTIPTFYNTILLFIPCLLLTLIACLKFMVKDKFRFHWAGLSVLFLYLAADEAAVIHEMLIKPMRVQFDQPGGIFFFTWVIPAIIFLALLGLAYLGFFLHLEPKFKLLLFSSIFLYFLGEVGGEMVSGRIADSIGQKNFTYAAASNVEEFVALLGLSLLAYSLLKYIQHLYPEGLVLKV